MANKRIFYACQAVGFAADGSLSVTEAHGVQSVAVNTAFNNDPVSELGQLELYENIENIPDVQVTVEKVLDGYPPVYLLATQGAPDATLSGRSNQKCSFFLSMFPDTQSFASGNPVGALWCSGMYYSQMSYTFPVDGNFTESITLVGNHKKWYATASQTPFDGLIGFGPNTDSPRSIGGSGGVNRREDLMFIYNDATFGAGDGDVNSMAISSKGCILPMTVKGVGPSGMLLKTGQDFNAHLQSITVSVDVGRDEIFELGRKLNYYRYITFPTPVNCEITALAIDGGDGVSATENGGENNAPTGSNLPQETIKLITREGLKIDLGTKNKLTGVNYSGGDTGGGNATIQYSYQNYNAFAVYHTYDPTTGLRIPQQNWNSGSQGSYT